MLKRVEYDDMKTSSLTSDDFIGIKEPLMQTTKTLYKNMLKRCDSVSASSHVTEMQQIINFIK